MGILVPLPRKSSDSSFSINGWLNSHMGCNVNKMMNGDKREIEKHEARLVERNIQERRKMLE